MQVAAATGLRLESVSASCSLYGPGDHLLVHDDLLADRRVAFILYLAPWAPPRPPTVDHRPLENGSGDHAAVSMNAYLTWQSFYTVLLAGACWTRCNTRLDFAGPIRGVWWVGPRHGRGRRVGWLGPGHGRGAAAAGAGRRGPAAARGALHHAAEQHARLLQGRRRLLPPGECRVTDQLLGADWPAAAD